MIHLNDHPQHVWVVQNTVKSVNHNTQLSITKHSAIHKSYSRIIHCWSFHVEHLLVVPLSVEVRLQSLWIHKIVPVPSKLTWRIMQCINHDMLKAISNLLHIDLIHGPIHSQSCKKHWFKLIFFTFYLFVYFYSFIYNKRIMFKWTWSKHSISL